MHAAAVREPLRLKTTREDGPQKSIRIDQLFRFQPTEKARAALIAIGENKSAQAARDDSKNNFWMEALRSAPAALAAEGENIPFTLLYASLE